MCFTHAAQQCHCSSRKVENHVYVCLAGSEIYKVDEGIDIYQQLKQLIKLPPRNLSCLKKYQMSNPHQWPQTTPLSTV
jgi:hypothetical protein